MCNDPLHSFLAHLPKCEHHLHIEGTLEPDLLFRLAAKNSIALPQDDAHYVSPSALRARYDADFANLDEFLGYYYRAMACLIDASDFEELAYAYFSRVAGNQEGQGQGVRHVEIFFDPQAHVERGVELSVVVEGLKRGKERALRDFEGFSVEIIMCLLKHLSPESAVDTFKQARDSGGGWFDDGTLLGVGMDSSELPFPPEMWVGLYDEVRKEGTKKIRRTIHAGEEGPPGYVRDAIEKLGVERIDHGIRAFEDEKVVSMLLAEGGERKEKIMLTTCPLSNLKLKCIDTLAEFPMRKLLDSGVRFSVNSDDPAYFGGYILDNYCALQETFGLTVEEWKGIAQGAVEGSWCSDERKKVILAEIEDYVAEWLRK